MSAGTKRKKVMTKEAEASPTKEAKQEVKKPTARMPGANVVSRHGVGIITRWGRGFSRGEVSGAGLSAGLADRWGLFVDSRRRSVLEPNVQALKKWLSVPTRRVEAPRAERPLATKKVRKKAPKKKSAG